MDSRPSLPNRLIPAGCRLITKEASTSFLHVGVKNDLCPICRDALQDAKHIIQHIDCGNAFCAEDLLEWSGSYQNATCPFCRKDLGVLRPHKFDLNRERLYLANGGLDEVRRVVGRPFDTAPLGHRVVHDQLPLDDLNITRVNVHAAMIGDRTEKYLNDFEMAALGTPDNPYAASFSEDEGTHIRTLERALTVRDDWRTRAIQTVTEYIFPEFSPHTRFLVPNLPTIKVVDSLHTLRRQTTRAREDLIADYAIDHPPGRWLRRVFTTEEMTLILRDQSNDTGSEMHRTMGAIRSDATDPTGGGTELGMEFFWALWITNHPFDNTLIAVPRWRRFEMLQYENGRQEAVLSSTFVTMYGEPIYPGAVSVSEFRKGCHTSDPQLYNYARIFDERLTWPFPGTHARNSLDRPDNARRLRATELSVPKPRTLPQVNQPTGTDHTPALRNETPARHSISSQAPVSNVRASSTPQTQANADSGNWSYIAVEIQPGRLGNSAEQVLTSEPAQTRSNPPANGAEVRHHRPRTTPRAARPGMLAALQEEIDLMTRLQEEARRDLDALARRENARRDQNRIEEERSPRLPTPNDQPIFGPLQIYVNEDEDMDEDDEENEDWQLQID
jgi:hypothetical protein